jgi:chromosome partitioning protein
MYDKRIIIAQDSLNHINNTFGSNVFKTVISKNVRLEESPAYKESIFTFAPNSKGAKEYMKLAKEVLKNG